MAGKVKQKWKHCGSLFGMTCKKEGVWANTMIIFWKDDKVILLLDNFNQLKTFFQFQSSYSPTTPFSPRLASSSSPPFTSASSVSHHFMGHGEDGCVSPLAGDEPRRRAPRALTGRYVRTGTGASREVLIQLRKKIEERAKLKELLGDKSQLYFGGMNKSKKGPANKSKNHILGTSWISNRTI